MADAAATIWAAVVAGLATLIGVGLGAWLSYGTTKSINEQQSKEAKRTRRISQLERLDRTVESLDSLVTGLLTQSIGYVGHGRKFESDGLTKVSLVECEFLTSVYLPEAAPSFEIVKTEFVQIGRIVGEIVLARDDKKKGSELLTDFISRKASMDLAIKEIRKLLVVAAREIEKI